MSTKTDRDSLRLPTHVPCVLNESPGANSAVSLEGWVGIRIVLITTP